MYKSEDQLQVLLADSPEFLLGETAESGSRPGYLLRRRGSPRAGRGGTGLVVPRPHLSRSRGCAHACRGEALDKHAGAPRGRGPNARLRSQHPRALAAGPNGAEFEARCEEAVPPLEPVGSVREISESEYEDYWRRVKTNLAAKRLRLVFVTDHIPTTLQTSSS